MITGIKLFRVIKTLDFRVAVTATEVPLGNAPIGVTADNRESTYGYCGGGRDRRASYHARF